jgi:hypothetical protein
MEKKERANVILLSQPFHFLAEFFGIRQSRIEQSFLVSCPGHSASLPKEFGHFARRPVDSPRDAATAMICVLPYFAADSRACLGGKLAFVFRERLLHIDVIAGILGRHITQIYALPP